MNVKEHYDHHLAEFYAWMSGDFNEKQTAFQEFLKDNGLLPSSTKTAIDLGAGHGIQSIALANVGYNVIAVDFNEQLLKELEINSAGLPVQTTIDDLRNVRNIENVNAELMVCCGDTITHLDSKEDIRQLIQNCAIALCEKGKLILSFRDYTTELTDHQRFIPVKSDENRILTCILEYEPERVKVTDLVHQRSNDEWAQKVSSYYKIRLNPLEVIEMINKADMDIITHHMIKGMQYIVAQKR